MNTISVSGHTIPRYTLKTINIKPATPTKSNPPRQMDSVIEKLSNLESIWRITSDEIVEVINSEYNEEFDVFKYKIPETEVHLACSLQFTYLLSLEDNWVD